MFEQDRVRRAQYVVDDLRRNETLTGYTWIMDNRGFSESDLKEIIEGDGYRWMDSKGGEKWGVKSRFQRLLPGEPRESGIPDVSSDPLTTFLGKLDGAEPNLRGTVSIDISGISHARPGEWEGLAAGRGWKAVESDGRGRDGHLYWKFARVGTTPVDDIGNEFIHGPPLGELRKHEAAVRTDRWCAREVGIDPLSDAELDKARATHKRLNKQAIKYGALFTIPFLVCVVFLLAAIGSGESAALLLVAVVAVPTVIGLVLTIRSTKRLKRATKRYRDAYTKVAAAAFGKQVPT